MGFSEWSTASAAGVAYLDRGVEEKERAGHGGLEDDEEGEDEEDEDADEARSGREGRTVLSAAAGMALKGLLRGTRRSEASMVGDAAAGAIAKLVWMKGYCTI